MNTQQVKIKGGEENQTPSIQEADKLYFLVFYVANSTSGQLTGQCNMIVTGMPYLNLDLTNREIEKLNKKRGTMVSKICITNIIQLTKEQLDCFNEERKEETEK